MSGSDVFSKEAVDQRARYVNAFNATMVTMWKDRQKLLGAIDTGKLYRSLINAKTDKDGRVLQILMEWNFRTYGVFVDRGTGKEVERGNPGDIGRDKKRKPKPWLSRAFFSSYANIRDFMAESLAQEFCAALPRILGSEKF